MRTTFRNEADCKSNPLHEIRKICKNIKKTPADLKSAGEYITKIISLYNLQKTSSENQKQYHQG